MADVFAFLAVELLLYAAVGFALFGLDDLLVDVIWLIVRPDRLGQAAFQSEPVQGGIAVLVPAWDEPLVIGQMIAGAKAAWAGQDYHLFIGTYANDLATQCAALAEQAETVSVCVLPQHGPTTKADCLNGLYQAATALGKQRQQRFAAFLLHDAEDRVDPCELELFRDHVRRADMVQIPVVPDLSTQSRFIAGHYADEFAEAHLKELPVRQWLGASIPSAGTGTALSSAALEKLAAIRGGAPFDPDCLTEDYELGLLLGTMGMRGRFVRQFDKNGRLIAVRSGFPATLAAAIRQKSRWIAGIAFAGWDRAGWHGDFAEHWMRWRDRRSFIAATVIIAGYIGFFMLCLLALTGHAPELGGTAKLLMLINIFLLFWRVMMRWQSTMQVYGWKEAMLSLPRLIVSNMIAILASFRALLRYWAIVTTGRVVWEKTDHALSNQEIE